MCHFQDQQKLVIGSALKGFDPQHQLFRLRHAKMTDAEALLIMRTFKERVRGYEAVVEVRLLSASLYRRS